MAVPGWPELAFRGASIAYPRTRRIASSSIGSIEQPPRAVRSTVQPRGAAVRRRGERAGIVERSEGPPAEAKRAPQCRRRGERAGIVERSEEPPAEAKRAPQCRRRGERAGIVERSEEPPAEAKRRPPAQENSATDAVKPCTTLRPPIGPSSPAQNIP